MTVVIGISGKIGAGKNYLADRMIEELKKRGHTAKFSSFAAPLKAELNSIVRVLPDGDEAIAASYNIPLDKVRKLRELLAADWAERGLKIDAYDRTEGVRRALQYLGTDIRRSIDSEYWVRLFHENLSQSTADYTFVTDVRFPNEADSIRNSDGVMLRLEVPEEIILDRTRNRDGLVYSAEALAHPSETALDDYPHFDLVVGHDFDVKEIVDETLNSIPVKA